MANLSSLYPNKSFVEAENIRLCQKSKNTTGQIRSKIIVFIFVIIGKQQFTYIVQLLKCV
jgi:hypothetical protein